MKIPNNSSDLSIEIEGAQYSLSEINAMEDSVLKPLFNKYCYENHIFSVDGSNGLTIKEAFYTAIQSVWSNSTIDEMRREKGVLAARSAQALAI